MTPRVLVLSSSTGSGHDMRAKAFAEWVQQLNPAIEVKIEQIIENGSLLGRFGVWLYNCIHRFAPALHNVYFFIVEAIIFSHTRSVSFGGRYYRKLLKSFQPTHVLSVHDSTNRGYFEDAKKILGNHVKCITYCGEFSGGFGYSMNWINPTCDLFIARTPDARTYAVGKGIRAERSAVFHKLLPPSAFAKRLDPDAIKHFRQQIGLEPNRFTLFLATGGFGANHHIPYLKAVESLIPSLQVIVVCGRNQRILHRVQKHLAASKLRAHVEGYSTRIPEFLQIANAVITRGGANTTMEALHYNCPILFDAMGGLMPQEHCTWRFVRDNQAAQLLRKPNDLRKAIEPWLKDTNRYAADKSRIAKLNPDECPTTLIQNILR